MADTQPRLLIVEDDPGLQRQLRWSFEGFDVETAGDRAAALTALKRFAPDVVTLDLGLPPDPGGTSEGFATLAAIMERAPDTKVIVVTGNNDRDNAIRAVGMGAHDFCDKPVAPELLSLIVARAARMHQLEADNRRLAAGASAHQGCVGLIAVSDEMAKVCATVEKLAAVDVSILVLGESGTGKEVLVRELHRLSQRAEHRLVAINCAAIPEALLESELFGHEKGAFTGAVKTTPGKIELAHRGMLFLDEIGDLPQPLQAKLLRFLQERVVERIGGREEREVDVRVVCATHQNLMAQIRAGIFREDLFYRINGATIRVPPLRDRPGDPIALTLAFLRRFAREFSKPPPHLAPEAKTLIEEYRWPGNVRELENCIRRAVALTEGPIITPDTLGLADHQFEPDPFNLREVRERAERRALQRALLHEQNNIQRAAELMGITRPTIYGLLKKYDITV